MAFDEVMTVSSAEGIDLDLTLAGIGSRGAALGIDLACQLALMIPIGLIAAAFGDAGLAFFAVAGFLVMVGYPIVAEGLTRGRTIGKAAMGLRVVTVDGGSIGFLAAATRGIVRLVDMLPGVFVVGVVAILATRRSQRLGDLTAGTVVVHAKTAAAHRKAEGRAADAGFHLSPVLSPEAAGWDVSAVDADEVAMVRSFLGRRDQLDPGTRADLAQTLAFQLMPKVSGVPLEGGPEHFLERVVSAKTSR